MTASLPPYSRASAPHDSLAIAGLLRQSTCDWPGRLVTTVLLDDCERHCLQCLDPDRADASTPGPLRWHEVRDVLLQGQGRFDGVVFSGGEPTLNVGLAPAMQEARDLGFGIGLHTTGSAPERLADVLPLVDWVRLDIAGAFATPTGVRGGPAQAYRSLQMMRAAGIEVDVRPACDPDGRAERTMNILSDLLRAARGRMTCIRTECRPELTSWKVHTRPGGRGV